jgi:tetratricopeptide (TPR) repeat protein
MKKTKYFIIIILLFSFNFSILASNKSDIYNAYINSNLVKWKKIIDEMESQKGDNKDFILELLNYQYGYIAWHVGNKKYDEAEKYIEIGERNIQILEKANYKPSSVNSYKAAFYGFKTGIYKIKAPFIGPKGIECAKTAIRLDSNNPYGYIQMGNADYYMPSIFGGSKSKAIELYEKALKLMEQDKEQIKGDWNYLNLLTMIALAYQELKYFRTSKVYFDKIVQIEPNYKWVKEDLYPKLLAKMK